MAYPVAGDSSGFAQRLEGNKETERSGYKLDQSNDGGVFGRTFYTARPRSITINHILTDAEMATLKNFYENNYNLSFTFAWERDGASYTGRFVAPPQMVERHAPDKLEVEVKLDIV